MALNNNVLTELYIDGAWVDISSDVQVRDDSGEISIKRGRPNEASAAQPCSLNLELNNRNGTYSPRNPLSTYFKKLGRNTPIRVSIEETPVYDAYSNTSGTGDLSWTHTPVGSSTGVCVFVWQYNSSTGSINSVTYGGVAMEREIFGLFVFGATNVVGYMYFLNQDIPTGAQTIVVDTTAVILRQASAVTVTGGTHAELDDTSTAYSNAAPSTNPLGSVDLLHDSLIFGSLLSDLDDGSSISAGTGYTQIGEHDIGTETVNVERSSVQTTPGAYNVSWTANSGHWGIMGVAVRCVSYRTWQEVSNWPAKYDLTGNDAWVELEAGGILRRLNQGGKTKGPSLKQYILANSPLAYWPLDDGGDSISGVNLANTNNRFNKSNGVVSGGSVNFGSGDLGATMDKGLNISYTGDTTEGYMYGYLAGNSTQTALALDFLYKAAQLGAPIFSIYTQRSDTGAVDRWKCQLRGNNTGNYVEITAELDITPTSSSAVFIGDSAVLPAITDGLLHHVRFQLVQNGGNVDITVYMDGMSVFTASQARTLGSGWYTDVKYLQNSAQTDLALGHMAVWQNSSIPLIADAYEAASSHLGETAGDRFLRLCDENTVPAALVGTAADSVAMGPQYPDNFIELLTEIERTDMGQLFETREAISLSYRTRTDLYNQTAKFTLDYSAGELGKSLEPVDDDQLTANDIFAQRREGSSFEVVDDTSPLSTQDPPDGVGRYKSERQVNVQYDYQLPDAGGWLLRQGTIDEARYPQVVVNLHSPHISSNATLLAALRAAEVGDYFIVENASSINIYDDVALIILGYAERISKFRHTIIFNCAPYSPYRLPVWDDAVAGPWRWDTAGSTLTAAINSSATSLSVASTETLWTQAAAEFPLDVYVGGERMTVTNITSATSPQTFTVTRSVNGVIKSHAIGTEVRLWDTPRYGW